MTSSLGLPEAHYDTVVCLKLLLHSVESEVVLCSVVQRSGRLELLGELDKVGSLIFIEEILNGANELNFDALVVEF